MLFQDKTRQEQLEVLNKLVDNQLDKNQPIKMVTYMNHIFATTTAKNIYSDQSLSTEDLELVESQLGNIYDELKELEEAINENDLHEVKDAIADIFTFAVGGLYILSEEPKEIELNDNKVDFDTNGKKALLLNTKVLMNAYNSGSLRFMDAFVFAEQWAKNLNFSLLDLLCNVTKANYGKIVFSFDELEKTLKQYQNKGVEVYVRFFDTELVDEQIKYAVVYSTSDQNDINGKQYRKNKFLKSIEFVAP